MQTPDEQPPLLAVIAISTEILMSRPLKGKGVSIKVLHFGSGCTIEA